jgi:hypothetical protein
MSSYVPWPLGTCSGLAAAAPAPAGSDAPAGIIDSFFLTIARLPESV